MLTPLNTAKIDTFLHQLPQRTELSQKTDSFCDRLEDVIYLTLGSEPSDAEPDTTVCIFIAVTKRPEDVAGLQRRGCARGT